MEPRTSAHLTTGERNHSVAQALAAPVASALLQPPPLEWAVVAAFYAAVHYVNAYLWEQLRYEPRYHADRRQSVGRVQTLWPTSPAYANLQDLAFRVRYQPMFGLAPVRARAAVQTDPELVATTVRQALGLPP